MAHALDPSLGIFEFFAAPLLLLALAWAYLRRRVWRHKALVAAVAFGVVLANPFGVVAVEEPPPPDTQIDIETGDDSAVRWLRLGFIPVAWWTPYEQDVIGTDTGPGSKLKLRYGFAFLPSTGASTVVDMCGESLHRPCWHDNEWGGKLVREDRRGRLWLKPNILDSGIPRDPRQGYTERPEPWYRPTLGLASPAGLAYWILLAPFLLSTSLRRATPPPAVQLALRRAALSIASLAAILLLHWLTSTAAALAGPAPSPLTSCVRPCANGDLSLWTPFVLAPYLILALGALGTIARGRRWSSWQQTLLAATGSIAVSALLLVTVPDARDAFPHSYDAASRWLWNQINDRY
jgi:hypothetical protein